MNGSNHHPIDVVLPSFGAAPLDLEHPPGYISSDTDDDEWGVYKEKVNEFSDCESEEEFDAGF